MAVGQVSRPGHWRAPLPDRTVANPLCDSSPSLSTAGCTSGLSRPPLLPVPSEGIEGGVPDWV